MKRGTPMLLLVLAGVGGVLAWKVPPAVRAMREAGLAKREHEVVVARVEGLAELRSKEHAVFTSRRATGDLVAQLGEATQAAGHAGKVSIASFDPMGEARVAIPALAQTDMDVLRQSVRVRIRAADVASLGRFLQAWSGRRTRWEPAAITLTFGGTPSGTDDATSHESPNVEADMVLATTFVESRKHGAR